ncbi:hypothetical protein DSCW_43400 [Desulfosarcina widdelii]|uniref:Uncharacterized protein n=1 Tax=Desulfosarcina widdelii TaxID=947919 RepID=A0A5K7ZAV0_9BACT|nr:hypothetical protein [Desulfosarcina widdelii]BBO76923.1 hypothetical protein DSCW_43400 [Desulfosarcina widdelii]
MPLKAKEIYEQYGIPTRRIQYFVDAGLVNCQDNPGRGPTGRTFSCDNLLELFLAEELSSVCRLELSKIKFVFEALKERWPSMLTCSTHQVDKPSGFFLVIFDGGEDIHFHGVRERETMKRSNIVDIKLSKYTSALVVNISKLYDRIKP